MLSVRQSVFLKEYLLSGNATQAALKAGYSSKTARSQAQRLLTKVDIQTAIQKFKNKMEKQTAVTLERVVNELAKVAFANMSDVLEVEENKLRIKNLSELSSDVQASIAEITESDTAFGKRRTIKMHNKLTSLDALMKHLGGYLTVDQMIDRMSETQLDQLTEKLLTKLKQNKPPQNDEAQDPSAA